MEESEKNDNRNADTTRTHLFHIGNKFLRKGKGYCMLYKVYYIGNYHKENISYQKVRKTFKKLELFNP